MITKATLSKRALWAAIGLIFLASVAVRLYLARHYLIMYDGYWHVFIAQQDNWKNFYWDIRANAHPHLYYFLLKLSLVFGRNPWAYRLVSLLTGIGSIWLTAKIAGKLSARWFSALLVVCAFGLAISPISISIEVRSYALSVFLMLAAFYFYIDLIDPDFAGRLNRSRALFAGSAILAVSSHYAVFFFVGACIAVPIYLGVVSSSYRKRLLANWKVHGLGHMLTFIPVAVTVLGWYRRHAAQQAVPQGHLASHYYTPGHGESVAGFLWRNLQSEFNVFVVWPDPFSASYRALWYLSLAAFLAAIYFCHCRPIRRSRPLTGVPLAFALFILASMAVASLLGFYPFGGDMRQQFIVFPFLILSGVCLLDEMGARIPSRGLREGIGIAALLMVLILCGRQLITFPVWTGKLFETEMTAFHQAVPTPHGVYLDQFSLIGFFIHYDDWRWHFVERYRGPWAIDRYELARGAERMTVCRDKLRWTLDFTQESLYKDIGQCLSATHLPSVAVFSLNYSPAAGTPEEEARFRDEVARRAGQASLVVRTLALQGPNVYAEFAGVPVMAGGPESKSEGHSEAGRSLHSLSIKP